MTEIWKAVPGFMGRYEVSDLGRIRSFAKSKSGRVRSLTPNSQGYLIVDLWSGNRPTTHRVNRLVLRAFQGEPIDGAEACHNNGDRLDNRLNNLRWDTRLENMRDIRRHGTHENARKTACPRGHAYDEANTYITPRGNRGCRACRLSAVRANRARTKESI
ncbi:NUMOD4 domain-containing protein [Subtercola endophyticus]|uniref:NUMOD4 domain-containing protein n=1 Tax=Subtercola endophyticus TaxID=2895559 RepID=UPI0036F31A9B